jgi:phospholipid/cholesterol/gamma-HCH transport system substrate-binding protein
MTLLIYALARLSGHTEKHDLYFTIFPNVAGISDGSPVTYDGYQVGHVQSVEPISLDGRMNYRVQLKFKQDWKIPVDSTASIGSSGLLSAQLIDVVQGKSKEFLKPGQQVKALDNPQLIAALGGLAGDLRTIAKDDMRPALQSLNRQVDSLGGMLERKGGMTLDQANAALARLNTVAENLAQILNAENRQHMNNILKSGDQTAVNLGQLLNAENRQYVTGILKNSDQATEKVNQTLTDFKQTEAEINNAMRQTRTILSNLERASRHMNELSRQLRESPSAIFTSPAPADLVETKK